MLKIFSNSVSTPIASISCFRSFRFISLVFFSLLVVISCGDTTAASDDGSNSCTTYGAESPQNKAELKAAIDKFYAECQNEADYSLIDVSAVTDMSELFKGNTNFNGDISSWNMSSVANVNSMFEGATKFNQDLSSWVLKAGVIAKGSNSPTKMFYKSGMLPKMLPTNNFYQYTPADKAALQVAISNEIATAAQGATADLSIIDTSQVTDMSDLFNGNTTFNGYIATWDTSKVEDMTRIFQSAKAFNQRIGDWDTSSVLNMSYMFTRADVFNQPIGNWKTGNVNNMSYMFTQNKAFDQPIGDWDTSKVRNFNSMFYLSVVFNRDLKKWIKADGAIIGSMFLSAMAMLETNKAPWMPGNNDL